MEVQEAERPRLALPLAAAPSLSHPRTRRRASARAAVALWADRHGWAARWDHPLRIAMKSLLLIAIVAVGVVLAGYAGVLPLLPASPPPMDMASAAHHARVTSWSYCWLSSGAGGCADGAPDDGHVASAPLVARPGQTVRVRFGYPSPSSCAATGAAAAGAATLKIIPEHPDGLNSGFALLAPAEPGTYEVSITCEWNPHRSLRWLRGFGHATYALALRVNTG